MSKALSQEKARPYFVLQCITLLAISLTASLARSPSVAEEASLAEGNHSFTSPSAMVVSSVHT